MGGFIFVLLFPNDAKINLTVKILEVIENGKK
ncbi:hypothetical protein AJ90_07640 [Vibrio parahaemolyticus M0605]|nr:hypothetical protein AJ90_07640 [Vibrio parahaemolyticus M0605]